MNLRYYDTSVVLCLLMHDKHAKEALSLWEGEHARVSSKLLHFECMTVIARHSAHLPKSISKRWKAEASSWLMKTTASMILHEINDSILRTISEELHDADIRTLDAIHLATAAIFAKEAPLQLVTFDARMKRAASFFNIPTLGVGSEK